MATAIEAPRVDGTVERWMDTLAAYVPPHRPLTVLDLGSGTGRFAPALAGTFGGPVYGVEPSRSQREIAARDAAHPNVTYLDGCADAIPLPDAHVDVALLFMSLHHFVRHDAAFIEIARVTAPAATVLVRCVFADRMPERYWYRYFPTVRTAVGSSYGRVRDVVAAASMAGLDLVTLDTVMVEPARPLRDLYTRVREVLTADPAPIPAAEITAGLAAMARDVADHGARLIHPPAADLLVLHRSAPR